MKSGVKAHFTRRAAKGKNELAVQDDRSNVAQRDRRDQVVVRLPGVLDYKGGGIN